MEINFCPLCHNDTAIHYRQEGHAYYEEGQWHFTERPLHIIYCGVCGHRETSYDGKDTVVFKWNSGKVKDWERQWYEGVD